MTNAYSPFELAGLALRCRVARSATELGVSDEGFVTPGDLTLYRDLAKNGVGLIFSCHMFLCDEGRTGVTQRAIGEDRFLPGLRALTSAVHGEGGVIAAQIGHSGFQAHPERAQPIGPCEVEGRCRAATVSDIRRVEGLFAEAAVRAREAGFDGMQLHAAHGYLLSEFLSRKHNRREDEYGGSCENRWRIVRETLSRVKAAAGDDFPVFIKLHCDAELSDDTFLHDLAWMLEDGRARGLAAAELSGVRSCPTGEPGEPYFLERARALRPLTRLPLILVGGMRAPEDVTAAMEAGMDMVSFSRPFICQSDLVSRLRAGERAACRSCNRCFSKGDAPHCIQFKEGLT